MRRRLFLVLLAFLLISCQILTPSPNQPDQPKPPEPGPTAVPTAATEPEADPMPTEQGSAPVEPTRPAPSVGEVDLDSGPLAWDPGKPFGGMEPVRWQAKEYAGESYTLPVDLTKVSNPGVIGGLTEAQRSFLSQSGFMVMPTGEKQFEEIRTQVSERYGQPYYLTTDAAYHALHITFDETLKALERDFFRQRMIGLTQAMLEQVQAYPAQGTPVEEDARLAAAYLAVALRLFDPQAELPGNLETLIQPQLAQIEAAAGRETSKLIPNFEDDYGAYKPVGHYAGIPELESYFRGMTWLGRVSMKFKDPQDPDFKPSRASLILTLALQEAELENQTPAAEVWKNINETLNFMIGPSDDPGPAELSALMAAVYGPQVSFEDLGDEAKWQLFLEQVEKLPAPRINSTFVTTTAQLEATRDWRLMGQRFTFDASIFQNLISDKVGTQDKQRKFPTGPDVMAVFGSAAAEDWLEESGETQYANYPEQLRKLQDAAQAQPEAEWLSRFYTGWLYSFFPQLEDKQNEAYPPYMRSAAWGYKEMNTALGSWAELKHDTVLYAKMPEFLGGGGPPGSGPAPAYVEPVPQVFYRLAYIANELSMGLSIRAQVEYEGFPDERVIGLDQLIPYMEGLGRRLQKLGDIAARELAGEALTEDDYYTIQGCLGVVECIPTAYPEPLPVPVVAAVSGAENEVLEVGVGNLDRIFVVVPINGELQVAQGGVFSYYEFRQPRNQRLADEEWRVRLESGSPARPEWTENFLVPGGEVRDVLAFRVNDWYIITEAGGNPPLNVRAQPSQNAEVLGKLEQWTYVQIKEGPSVQGSQRWWKVYAEFEGIEGWVLENPEWFERAHGQ